MSVNISNIKILIVYTYEDFYLSLFPIGIARYTSLSLFPLILFFIFMVPLTFLSLKDRQMASNFQLDSVTDTRELSFHICNINFKEFIDKFTCLMHLQFTISLQTYDYERTFVFFVISVNIKFII